MRQRVRCARAALPRAAAPLFSRRAEDAHAACARRARQAARSHAAMRLQRFASLSWHDSCRLRVATLFTEVFFMLSPFRQVEMISIYFAAFRRQRTAAMPYALWRQQLLRDFRRLSR